MLLIGLFQDESGLFSYFGKLKSTPARSARAGGRARASPSFSAASSVHTCEENRLLVSVFKRPLVLPTYGITVIYYGGFLLKAPSLAPVTLI